MDNDLRGIPIIRDINPFTGALQGNDTGYREVQVSTLDAENPDPLVVMNDQVACVPLYAVGATTGLCTYYAQGLGGPDKILVRAPVATGLLEANCILKPYGRQLLVVDGWRPWWVQAALWAYLRNEIIAARGLIDGQLTVAQEIEIGLKADDVGSYCSVVTDEKSVAEVWRLLDGPLAEQVAEAVTILGKDSTEIAGLYLTFQANLGRNSNIRIQEDAITAHGNGGAVDLWMLDTNSGPRPSYVNLGVPFDYVPLPGTSISPAVINYFDMPEVSLGHYQSMVASDPTLQRYLRELGIEHVTLDTFEQAQRERRLLFHTMMRLGGTYFSLDKDLGEPWHFQLGNERGGRQASVLPGSGNACHAKLKGLPEANWSNAVGHRLARELLAR